jgi:hypothetical protein
MLMDKKKKKLTHLNENTDTMVVSSTDCTGLIPSMPKSEEEIESYNDIYKIPEEGNINTL